MLHSAWFIRSCDIPHCRTHINTHQISRCDHLCVQTKPPKRTSSRLRRFGRSAAATIYPVTTVCLSIAPKIRHQTADRHKSSDPARVWKSLPRSIRDVCHLHRTIEHSRDHNISKHINAILGQIGVPALYVYVCVSV